MSDKPEFPEFTNDPPQECETALYHLGCISVRWNMCEDMLSNLIWEYVGGVSAGISVAAKLKNEARADLLLQLARENDTNPEFVDRIEFVVKAFNRLSEVRNILVHSLSIQPHESGKFEWWKRSNKSDSGLTAYLAGENELEEISQAVGRLTALIMILWGYQMERQADVERRPLPAKFPLPDTLTQLPLTDQSTY